MAELRSLWTWLDAAGADWISVWDHLYEAPAEGGTQPHFEAIAVLGAMAADTSRARLGCLVFCAPYRNIGLFAKSVVSIDHISGGRFELGIGSGWYDAEALAYGLHFPSQRERFNILEEQLDVLRAWFRGERVTKHGSYVALEDASLVPGPLGRMPIWVGGVGRRRTLRMAGAVADGWNAAYISPAEFRELGSVLDDWCEKAGREATDVERGINLMFNLSTDDVATVRSKIEEEWGDRADRVRDGSLMGRPEDVLDQVAPYIDAGAQLINVVIRPPWDKELLDAYVTDVLPAMRKEWS
jgi:alkanesulfonate monooxygenase SsuD/methylene tetrahydromethanopterin reductase-like flavin-dependent oxidoreductase (luciferase family)